MLSCTWHFPYSVVGIPITLRRDSFMQRHTEDIFNRNNIFNSQVFWFMRDFVGKRKGSWKLKILKHSWSSPVPWDSLSSVWDALVSYLFINVPRASEEPWRREWVPWPPPAQQWSWHRKSLALILGKELNTEKTYSI